MSKTIPWPNIPGLIVCGRTAITLSANIDTRYVEFTYDDGESVDPALTVDGTTVVSVEVGCGGALGRDGATVATEVDQAAAGFARDAVSALYHESDHAVARKVLRAMYRALDKRANETTEQRRVRLEDEELARVRMAQVRAEIEAQYAAIAACHRCNDFGVVSGDGIETALVWCNHNPADASEAVLAG